MTKLNVNINNTKKVEEVIASVQSTRCQVRLLDPERVKQYVKRVEWYLEGKLLKSEWKGIVARIGEGGTFPRSYRGIPESTKVTIRRGSNAWFIISAERSECEYDDYYIEGLYDRLVDHAITRQADNKKLTNIELGYLVSYASQHPSNWSMIENADVSRVTDMSGLFRNKGVEHLDLSKWDTSNVTDMSDMFKGSNFNQPLNFNTSKVKNMSGMFKDSKYNHPLNFNTSKVKNMSDMFEDSKYNHPLNFNTSNVRNMSRMFKGSIFNQPLNFNTSKVWNMSAIFSKSEFKQDISNWIVLDTKENRGVLSYWKKCVKRNEQKEKKAIKAAIQVTKRKKVAALAL